MSTTLSPLEHYCRTLDICNPSVEDSVVEGRIKRECPPGLYSWILVRSAQHQFQTISGRVNEHSRLVQFMPTNWQALRGILCIIFQRTEIEALNINRVVLGLLNSPDERDKQSAKSAYWQNYTIKLYVSMGGSFSVDMLSEQGSVTKKVSGLCTLL